MARGKRELQEVPTVPTTPVASPDVPSAAPDAPPVQDTGDSLPDDGGRGTNDDAPVVAPTPEAQAFVEAVDEFIAWGKSDNPEADYDKFVALGLLDGDHALTDKGCEILDGDQVPYRFINFLTLGVPLTYVIDGEKHHINAGSTLRVKHGGQADDGVKFWVCDAGEMLPETVVYFHRLHILSSARYPLTQPLQTVYKTGAWHQTSVDVG